MVFNVLLEFGNLEEQIIQLSPTLPVNARSVDGVNQGTETKSDLLFKKVKLFFGGTSHAPGLYMDLQLPAPSLGGRHRSHWSIFIPAYLATAAINSQRTAFV